MFCSCFEAGPFGFATEYILATMYHTIENSETNARQINCSLQVTSYKFTSLIWFFYSQLKHDKKN